MADPWWRCAIRIHGGAYMVGNLGPQLRILGGELRGAGQGLVELSFNLAQGLDLGAQLPQLGVRVGMPRGVPLRVVAMRFGEGHRGAQFGSKAAVFLAQPRELDIIGRLCRWRKRVRDRRVA
jgi:hypothetical protein